jgi:RHS repeat-associated protein
MEAFSTHEKLTIPTVNITELGYIYIFVSNESENREVWFDDLKVTHQRSTIVAGADYYPFGLVMENREITREDYRYGYQGQLSEKDKSTGWNEFELRMYDPKIGRWLSADPYGQFASPYVGMGNAPDMGVDPNGGFWGMGAVASGALFGAAVGTVVGLIVGSGQWYLFSLAGASLGALGGAIYNSSTYDLKA